MKTAEQIQSTISLLQARKTLLEKELLMCPLRNVLDIKHETGKLKHTLNYLKYVLDEDEAGGTDARP